MIRTGSSMIPMIFIIIDDKRRRVWDTHHHTSLHFQNVVFSKCNAMTLHFLVTMQFVQDDVWNTSYFQTLLHDERASSTIHSMDDEYCCGR